MAATPRFYALVPLARMRLALLIGVLVFATGVLLGAKLYSPATAGLAQPSLIDRFQARRNLDVSKRAPMPCPPTDLILVLGQSNAANYFGERFKSTSGAVDWLDGKCYSSAGSTLGGDGIGGSIWPLVGGLLLKAQPTKPVVFASLAMGASSSAEWADPDALGGLLQKQLASMGAQGARVGMVVWHQGESDAQTELAQYAANVRRVIDQVQAAYPDARFVIAQASICNSARHANVVAAQRSLVDGRTVFAGPDTDAIDEFSDRYDGCHFSGVGARKQAQAWADAIDAARH